MRDNLLFVTLLLLLVLIPSRAQAYFNATYLTTTLFLSNSTSAHVAESVQLYVSNSSVGMYDRDRQAFNLSLTSWQKAVGSPLLGEHILNPKGSISNFTFLPGPLTPDGNGGGYASLTMSYDAQNVTSVVTIAPRKFEYSFNNTVFSFLHSGSGQSLLTSTRLTIVLPTDTQVVAVRPTPDYPQPNSVGKYNSTSFAWFSGEPLQNFNFVYIVTQTPQQEVVAYFTDLYNNHSSLIYLMIILIVAAAAFYIYSKVFR